MRYLACFILLMLTACRSTPKIPERQAMPARKAAIAERMLYEIYTIHFDTIIPAGHPFKVEEYMVSGWKGERKDTISREYFFENDRLIKVLDNEFGGNSTYILKYDDQGRRTLIDQQTPNGSFHKDTFEYQPDGPFEAIRKHFMFDKREETRWFQYYGSTDSLVISSTEGPEKCYFREVNDSMFVQRMWWDNKNILMSNKIEAYDKNNRLCKVTYLENSRIDRVIYFTYDQHGNQLSRVDKDADNIVGGSAGITAISSPNEYHSVYEYDSRGNWIRKTEKSKNDKYNAITTRKISYVK